MDRQLAGDRLLASLLRRPGPGPIPRHQFDRLRLDALPAETLEDLVHRLDQDLVVQLVVAASKDHVLRIRIKRQFSPGHRLDAIRPSGRISPRFDCLSGRISPRFDCFLSRSGGMAHVFDSVQDSPSVGIKHYYAVPRDRSTALISHNRTVPCHRLERRPLPTFHRITGGCHLQLYCVSKRVLRYTEITHLLVVHLRDMRDSSEEPQWHLCERRFQQSLRHIRPDVLRQFFFFHRAAFPPSTARLELQHPYADIGNPPQRLNAIGNVPPLVLDLTWHQRHAVKAMLGCPPDDALPGQRRVGRRHHERPRRRLALQPRSARDPLRHRCRIRF